MATAHLNGIDLYYEEMGEGPNLLFFNGSMSTLDEARMMVQVYADGLHVAAHDQRGLGKTSMPPGPYTMADYAADGIALIDHLGWDTCRVVGTSFGGMVAQEMAVTVPRPRRAARPELHVPGRGRRPVVPAARAARPLPERGPGALDDADRQPLRRRVARHPRPRPDARRGHGQPLGRRAGHRAGPGEREQTGGPQGPRRLDRLPRITCPTLVASGRYDGIAPPANGEAIASQIPNADFRVYDGGHAFFAQDPTAFPEILAFLFA